MAEPDDNPDVGTSTPATNPLPGPDVHSSVPQPTEQPLPVEPTDVSEALYDAAEDGLLERVQALLLASPRADLESKHGGFQEETALCAAARNNHLDVVKCLVSAGALLDCTNYWHETPLHVSAHEGHFDIVQYLVQNIIDREDDVNLVDYVNLVDDGDETALHRAAEGSNVELVECLIEAGARIEVFNCDGRNPAMCASESDKSSAACTSPRTATPATMSNYYWARERIPRYRTPTRCGNRLPGSRENTNWITLGIRQALNIGRIFMTAPSLITTHFHFCTFQVTLSCGHS